MRRQTWILAVSIVLLGVAPTSAQRSFKPPALCANIDEELAIAIEAERRTREEASALVRTIRDLKTKREALQRRARELADDKPELERALRDAFGTWKGSCCDGAVLRCESRGGEVIVRAVDPDDARAAGRVRPCQQAFAADVRPPLQALHALQQEQAAIEKELLDNEREMRDAVGRYNGGAYRAWVSAKKMLAAVRVRKQLCEDARKKRKRPPANNDWYFDRARQHEKELEHADLGTPFFGLPEGGK